MNDTALATGPKSLYDLTVKSIDGRQVALSEFRGKALLIVNVASQCGYTKQYADLQKLYEKYKDRGFEILAFPSNDFGGQEPGTDAEIREFCSSNYGVSFPVFSKLRVKGDEKHEIYRYLTAGSSPLAGEVTWNFEKFLLDREGRIISRFKSKIEPMSREIIQDIESALE